MKCLYIDAFSGISGDMTVGALLALGVPLDHLRRELGKLSLTGYRIDREERSVNGIAAVKFHVHLDHQRHGHVHDHAHDHAGAAAHGHRPYRDIAASISASTLSDPVKQTALKIFARLAAAESQIHGVSVEEVEFHEVGAIDSIVDIVATAIGLDHLGVERLYVSPLPLGSGVVRSQHGPIPVPAPATAELLREFPTRVGDGEGELVTPTGAAIVAALAEVGKPALKLQAMGYGAGEKVWTDRPNLLRLMLGEITATAADTITVIECNIDDLNPEIYEHVFEKLLGAGALDVYLTPVQMKKGRPGCVLTILCSPSDRDSLSRIVLSETTSIGLRYVDMARTVLARRVETVETEWGPVRVKIAESPNGDRNVAPEYDDCRRIAHERQVALKQVYLAAQVAARR